jgi:hypothetical protein
MQKRIGMALAVAGLAMVPALAQAQARGGMAGMGEPKHEFGVDVGIAYSHIGSLGGVSCTTGCSGFTIGTPVDVRIGLVSSGNMMWEPRFTFNFVSQGGTSIQFDPGVNVLFKMGQSTARNHNKYFTVGVDANILSSSPTGGTSTSGVILGFNAGVGMRNPLGSAATRMEAFLGYKLSNTTLNAPSTLLIGARIGLSLWH